MDVRTFCLGILTLGDASGYEIKKIFETQFSHFYDASFGSIYPALNRLTEEGLVSCTTMSQAHRPDKKTYCITVAGRLAFLDALRNTPRRDRIKSDFLAIMSFAHLLPAGHLGKLIDERIADQKMQIQHMEDCLADLESPGARFVCGYGLAAYKAMLDYLENNRYLVESEAISPTSRAAE